MSTQKTVEGQVRHLPTGAWILVSDDQWQKLCPRCGGEGGFSYYRFIYAGICYKCDGTKIDPTVKPRSTVELDKKEAADLKRAAQREAKQKAEAELRAAEFNKARQKKEAEEAANAASEKARKDAEIAASRHLDAEVGEKVQITGTVAKAITYEAASYSGWGTDLKRIIAVSAGDGVTVKMFTQAGWAFSVGEGDEVTIAGTVKEHGEWEGVRETTIVRPQLKEHIVGLDEEAKAT